MNGVVLICAFDPIDELDGGIGVLAVPQEVADRLVASHRCEYVETNKNDEARFVTGSAAYVGARDALRARRSDTTRKRGKS